jgi:general secretion pathway protein D
VACSLLPLTALTLHGADSAPSSDQMSGSQSAQMESVKRQQLIFTANQAITDGRRLMEVQKYDEAHDRFRFALDSLTNGGSSTPIYNQAAEGLAAADSFQAKAFAKDGKFAQAAAKLREAVSLQPNNPVYPQLIEELKQEQVAYEDQVRDPEGTVNNPAVTDEFREKVATVQKLLFQGDAYFHTGQFDTAEDTYSKILILDPYNKAAREKMAYVERYKKRADGFRHEQYEQEGYTKLDLKWSEAISPDIVIPPSAVVSTGTPSNRAIITRKLQTIIIDKINFDKLDIATVIQFLTQKSKELDPDHVGINFVLRLTSDTPPAPETPAAGAPGAAPAAGTPGAAAGTPGAADAAAAAAQKEIHREVTINLENVPLADVLGYIIQQTNLQYTVEDFAVYLRPSVDEGETLTVRTYLVPPGFFTGSSLKVTTASSADSASDTIESLTSNVQSELANRGIRFPNGSAATFLPGSSKLVVRNTPEQLDLIANLIDQLNKETPQVEIEAKLAEFTQDAIKAFTFNYLVGSPGSPFSGAESSLRSPLYTTTAGGGLSPDGVNSLILQNNPTSAVYPINAGSGTLTYSGGTTGSLVAPNQPNTLEIGGVLDGAGLTMVIQAINNMTGVSLLSAPSVTTQNGLKANIDIVREFPYPTSFEKPKLSNTEVEYTQGGEAFQPLQLATPPTPREFVSQDVGVSLEVKPTTYPDQRIDLDITKASVVDFDGFIDYGVPIVERNSATSPAPTSEGVILTPGTINQPVFNIRSIVTNLQVLDGQTAVLGGLVREDTQEVNDKIPVLGDLPLLGRLFQSKVSQRTKKTLLLFITANLIRSNGKPEYVKTLNADIQEAPLPEPAPISSGINLPPLPPGGGGS